jgi:Asp-tRNA(Asn)/Glu-tRNA(Gln) amidotransferase A subunit family amidase
MTILEAAAALRARKVSSLELVNDSLARIARSQPKLNAFITVLEDAAAREPPRSTPNFPTAAIAVRCTASRSRTKI